MNEQMVAELVNQINSDLPTLNWDGTQFGGSFKPAPPPTFFFGP
jgi:hypothetical protein